MGNHVLHLIPRHAAWLDRHRGPVKPIQEPVFEPMEFLVLVDVASQLVSWATPRKLPTPIAFRLIVPRMRVNIIKAQAFKLRICKILLAIFPFFFNSLLACFIHLRSPSSPRTMAHGASRAWSIV